MKRRVYIDDLGPYIKHEGYIWRPLKPLHIYHGPSCQCGSRATPGESVECSATFGQAGPGLLSVRFPAKIPYVKNQWVVEHWTVRWTVEKRHEIKPGVFQGDLA